jgi:integrase
LSHDAHKTLVEYLQARPSSRVKRVFLIEKGRFRGKPIKVRGIQHYTQKAGLDVSCHQLRHTIATQLLNADADLGRKLCAPTFRKVCPSAIKFCYSQIWISAMLNDTLVFFGVL